MKKLAMTLWGLALIGLLGSGLLMAKEESQAVFSPKCDLKKFKKICGDPCITVEEASYKGGYIVKMDTDKLSWDKLIQKLVQEKCT